MRYVILVAAIVVARLFLYGFLKRLFMMLFVRAGVNAALTDVGRQALAQQPDRVVLAHRDMHSWKGDPAVARFAEALFSKGFQEGGLFDIREMPGVMVRFLVKSAECVVAAIFVHSKAGVWLDLVTWYQDGRTATFSTNHDHGLDPRPGHPIVYAPGLSTLALYAKTIGERPKGVFKPLLAEDIVAAFERGYAESIAWRKSKGIGAAEVVQVARRKTG